MGDLMKLLCFMGIGFLIGYFVRKIYDMLYPQLCSGCATRQKRENFWDGLPNPPQGQIVPEQEQDEDI